MVLSGVDIETKSSSFWATSTHVTYRRQFELPLLDFGRLRRKLFSAPTTESSHYDYFPNFPSPLLLEILVS